VHAVNTQLNTQLVAIKTIEMLVPDWSAQFLDALRNKLPNNHLACIVIYL